MPLAVPVAAARYMVRLVKSMYGVLVMPSGCRSPGHWPVPAGVMIGVFDQSVFPVASSMA